MWEVVDTGILLRAVLVVVEVRCPANVVRVMVWGDSQGKDKDQEWTDPPHHHHHHHRRCGAAKSSYPGDRRRPSSHRPRRRHRRSLHHRVPKNKVLEEEVGLVRSVDENLRVVVEVELVMVL